MPIILFSAQDGAVRYDFTLWATPLPTVKDWKKAYDWPTEGENYLNWIAVKATNTGADRAEAKFAFERRRQIAFGESQTNLVARPRQVGRGLRADSLRAEPDRPTHGARKIRKSGSSGLWTYWRGVLAGAAKIEVPCRKATDALKAAHVCQLIASDHGSIHGGEGFYDEFLSATAPIRFWNWKRPG